MLLYICWWLMQSSWQQKSTKTGYKNFWMRYRCFERHVSRASYAEDVSRTWKCYARNKQPWTSCFIGYLYMRVTSASVTSTASRKRSASDSPLAWTKPWTVSVPSRLWRQQTGWRPLVDLPHQPARPTATRCTRPVCSMHIARSLCCARVQCVSDCTLWFLSPQSCKLLDLAAGH